ncbi:MAG: pyridoxal 5'-phosphate synthase glutaminase subunit PdxT [Actinomycetota bacterium]|jgi:5'-phosphate synthase pdxT subunit
MVRVGVLALQGDVREHREMLESLEVEVVSVKRPEDLRDIRGIIFPGGESTAIAHLLRSSGLKDPLSELIQQGFPVFGTCAGLILLSREILDGRADQWSFGALDVAVRRNGYGRQIASFEVPVEVDGIGQVEAVFIRAPKIEQAANEVTVLASLDKDGTHPVLVRNGNLWGCSFHPELTTDSRIHDAFVQSL